MLHLLRGAAEESRVSQNMQPEFYLAREQREQLAAAAGGVDSRRVMVLVLFPSAERVLLHAHKPTFPFMRPLMVVTALHEYASVVRESMQHVRMEVLVTDRHGVQAARSTLYVPGQPHAAVCEKEVRASRARFYSSRTFYQMRASLETEGAGRYQAPESWCAEMQFRVSVMGESVVAFERAQCMKDGDVQWLRFGVDIDDLEAALQAR